MSRPSIPFAAIVMLVIPTMLLSACFPPPPEPPSRNYQYPPRDPNLPGSDADQPYGQPPPPPTRPGEYPTATRTENPNEVISPYEPFNRIDVSDFTSGQLARDPHNQKIFRVP